MKTKIIYILPILFLAACMGNNETETKPAPLYPQPQTIAANIEGGYTTNTITGDTIQPIILESGDTLITGIPIPAEGKTIHPDSVAQPKVVLYTPSDSTYNAHPNVHKIPDNLIVIPVNKDSLTTILVGEIAKNDTSHYFVNSTGDTLKTGIPIPIIGKKVPATHPLPIKALLPRFKDAAINNMQYLDVDQGMASSYVFSMLEDKSGNIWFGTRGGGVSRYDGESFTHFTTNEGLSHNKVSSILEDKSGNLWFGTLGGGVSRYNGESFTHFTTKEGLSHNHVLSMLEDKSGNLWFGTSGGGVSRYDPSAKLRTGSESFTHFTTKEGLSNNKVYSILEDKSGNLWFGTLGGGVSRYDPSAKFRTGSESFTHFTTNEGLSNNYVLSMLEDKSGNLWFGTTGGGMSRYDGESFTHFTTNEGLSNNTVWSMLEDKSGNLWFGTLGGGVSCYDPSAKLRTGSESFTHFTTNEGLSNNNVFSILQDKSGNLWFGTWGGGVSRYDGESFAHFTTNEGLSNNNVWSMLEDKSGNLWFGTWAGGVSRYDGESFTHFTTNEGLSDNYVLSMLEDKSGNIWLGTIDGGVSRYDPSAKLRTGSESFTHFTTNEGLSNNAVLSMLEDKSGNLWFGTEGGGVSCYDPSGKLRTGSESFTHFTTKEGLSNNSVNSILEDKSGNLWFGTYGGGVSRYDGKCFTHFTTKEGLSHNIVMSMLEDKSGNLWFGTSGGGVSRYDPSAKLRTGSESFTHFTTKEGLSNNTVWSILEDNSDNIWISTESGLNSFVYSVGDVSSPKSDKKVAITTFEKNDGLKALAFYANSVLLDSKNRIWWGSGKSLSMLDLNRYTATTTPPLINLKQLNINDQFIDYRQIKDSLDNDFEFNAVQQFENYPLNLKLPYDKNHLTFHFSAIDWSAPHKIQYSYSMEGLNTNWSQPSNEAKADYRNIPYGTFIFKVRAIGVSGEWSEPFAYEFTIHPPWWHTWWARAGYAIASLLLIFGFVKWRTAKLKERQKELETEVEIATKDLTHKNIELGNKNIEIEKQKEVLELAHKETEKQKAQVEEAHKEITDSINYAERIQRSFLATDDLLSQNLNDYFVFFQPKDVVSGDFYWAGKLSNGDFAMVNADSTGHGVPGAIMSILNISSIEEAIKEGSTAPSQIFNKTRNFIIERLKKDGSPEGGKDGMDASIICFDFENNRFSYTAAQNPIWIIRGGELIEIKPEKMPIGKHDKDNIPFVGGEFEIQKGDQIYTLTDGFQDQFGGPKSKKFMVKNLREYVLSISHLPMQEQHQKFKEAFANWKGDVEQVDDVCVIGVKI
jgi:ligand-binding sensor domain-containing protein/serine phosphatase RsbU (regulator of sigma subunit)